MVIKRKLQKSKPIKVIANYQPIINVVNYSGPFDLLLELVKNKKINLLDLNLVEITNEYLKITNKLINDYNLEIMSEYLVIAATLINLKANILLKPPQEQVKIAQAKQSLLNRLVLYQQFKNAAVWLRRRESLWSNTATKSPHNPKQFRVVIEETSFANRGSIIKLIIAFRQMCERQTAAQIKQTIIEPLNWSPSERRLQLLNVIEEQEKTLWNDVFHVPSINHFALTWITLLDMANKQEVILQQKKLFGDILISKIIKKDGHE